MADQRLTDKDSILSIADADLIHIVDTSDITSNPSGTSKKGLWSLIKSTLKTYFDSLYAFHEFACSDETSDLETGTVYEQRLLRSFTDCSSFDFGVITAPTGSTIIIDVQKNGTTVFDTKPTIDIGEFTTLTAATPQVITGGSVSFSAGDILKVVIDQVGSTIAGVNLKSQITYNA